MDRRKNASTEAAYLRWVEALDRLAMILDKTPLDVAERWGADVYQYEGRNVVGFAAFNHYFALWFYNGVFLSDPLGVLINANDEVTRSLRQWRMTSLDEIDEEAILRYVDEAIALERRGVRLAPLPSQPGEMPEALRIALLAEPDGMAAWERLSPGYQKEYNLYIAEAKREETRQRRVEKVVPMVLSGRSLNDKYKKKK